MFLNTDSFVSASRQQQKQPAEETVNKEIIVDCNYTFAEAIEGTKAPRSVTEQLELIDVEYYSMDGKIHRGQILTNKKLVADIKLHLNLF